MPARDDLARLVSRRIAKERVAAGLTQEALATRLDIATKNLQRIESGKQNLTLRTIERVADALRVDRGELLVGASARPAQPSALGLLVDAGFVVVPVDQPKQRPVNAVPIVDLLAAAGAVRGAPRRVDTLGWTVLHRRAPPPDGYFVAQVRGGSMAPRVPSGAVCLFGPARSPAEGRIVLVQHGAITDTDIGGHYAIKILGGLSRRDGRTRVTLRSLDPDHPPIAVETTGDDELRVVAELIEVVARP